MNKMPYEMKIPKHLYVKTLKIRDLQKQQRRIEDSILEWFIERNIDVTDTEFEDVMGNITNADFVDLEHFQRSVNEYLRKSKNS